MKKNLILSLAVLFFTSNHILAVQTVFDSMGNAKEVKLAPAIYAQNTNNYKNTSSTSSAVVKNTIKEQKFTSAITNLDDAQTELRQELAEVTEKYNLATAERQRAIENCKILKKELKTINKNIKNIENAKKNINKNINN